MFWSAARADGDGAAIERLNRARVVAEDFTDGADFIFCGFNRIREDDPFDRLCIGRRRQTAGKGIVTR